MKKNNAEEQFIQLLRHSHSQLSNAAAHYISSLLSLLDICNQEKGMPKETLTYCKAQILVILQTVLQIDSVSSRKYNALTIDEHYETDIDNVFDELIDVIDESNKDDPQSFLNDIRRSLYQKNDFSKHKEIPTTKHVSTVNSPPPWINQNMNKKK